MRNWGGVRVFVWAALIGISSVLIVDVGVIELLALILLFCGMLHMTRGLEGERSMEVERAEWWNKRPGVFSEKKYNRANWGNIWHKGTTKNMVFIKMRQFHSLIFRVCLIFI